MEKVPFCVRSRPVVLHAYIYTEDGGKGFLISFKDLAIEQTPIPANTLRADKLFTVMQGAFCLLL